MTDYEKAIEMLGKHISSFRWLIRGHEESTTGKELAEKITILEFIIQALTKLQELENLDCELPEKRKLPHEKEDFEDTSEPFLTEKVLRNGIKHYKNQPYHEWKNAYNQAIDECEPIVRKLKARISELEEDYKDFWLLVHGGEYNHEFKKVIKQNEQLKQQLASKNELVELDEDEFRKETTRIVNESIMHDFDTEEIIEAQVRQICSKFGTKPVKDVPSEDEIELIIRKSPQIKKQCNEGYRNAAKAIHARLTGGK